MLPEQKDVADILRRMQGLAAQSNLTIQRFTPQPAVQQALYAEVPFKLQAEGTYHNLGYFFDRISKFPRIINVSDISIRANDREGLGGHDRRRMHGHDVRAAGRRGEAEQERSQAAGAAAPSTAGGKVRRAMTRAGACLA